MREEMEKLKDEAPANKDYMLQAEKLKEALEDEVSSLRNQVSELESKYILKTEEAASAIEAKEQALRCISAETLVLKNEIADKMTQVKEMELLISSLRDDLDKEHKRWRTAQDNYERQVILQSETIQELRNTSKELALLQGENAKLRQLTETLKTENLEALPPAKQSDLVDELRNFKQILERNIGVIQISKNNIQEVLRDIDKQILSLLNTNIKGKVTPSQLQGDQHFQNSGGPAYSIGRQQTQTPLQQLDSHVNQAHLINLQRLSARMQSASVPHLTIPSNQQQTSINNLPQGSVNTLQLQSNVGSLQHQQMKPQQQIMQNQQMNQQKTVQNQQMNQQLHQHSMQQTIPSNQQQTSINNLPQCSVNTSQLQSNVGLLQHCQMKSQLQIMQNQQMNQQSDHHSMQQLMQILWQQLMQNQQLMQQLTQQKQQQSTTQIPMNQMSPIDLMNDRRELMVRQISGIKPGVYQQQNPTGQRLNYNHQQLKSAQNLQASSPQISPQPSPQFEQQNLLVSHPKSGTPLQSTNSPFIVPSPSTPIAPFPIPAESEKLSVFTSIKNAVNVGSQQTNLAPTQVQSLAVGTPGISAYPFSANFFGSRISKNNNAVPEAVISPTAPKEADMKPFTSPVVDQKETDFTFLVAPESTADIEPPPIPTIPTPPLNRSAPKKDEMAAPLFTFGANAAAQVVSTSAVSTSTATKGSNPDKGGEAQNGMDSSKKFVFPVSVSVSHPALKTDSTSSEANPVLISSFTASSSASQSATVLSSSVTSTSFSVPSSSDFRFDDEGVEYC